MPREKKYPGAKNAPGVYQAIINEMPPHETYIEACAGGGAILLRKKPATSTIIIDTDAAALESLKHKALFVKRPAHNLRAIVGDCRSLIAGYSDAGSAKGVLIYCDPPYVWSARRSPRMLYGDHEWDDESHRSFLRVVRKLKCHVMISGYRNVMYDDALATWRRVDYRTATRAGSVVESLWCNFPKVARPHDLAYLGANFRERERMKRQRARWRARLERMPEAERAALLAELLELASPKTASPAGSHRQIRREDPALARIAGSGDATDHTPTAPAWARAAIAGSYAGIIATSGDASGGGNLVASTYSPMLESKAE